jgi:hypothetical protein
MFNNCYTFNKPTDDVFAMAKRMEQIFDEKWSEKPAVFDSPKKHKSGKRTSRFDDSDSDSAGIIAGLVVTEGRSRNLGCSAGSNRCPQKAI